MSLRALGLIATLLFALPAHAGEELFLPTHACRDAPLHAPGQDGSLDLAALARALVQSGCMPILLPRTLITRRVAVTLSDAPSKSEKTHRIQDALTSAGLYRERVALAVIETDAPGQPILDENAILIEAPPGCSPNAPAPPARVHGEITLRALGAKLAELSCTPLAISRAMAARRVAIEIDEKSSDRRIQLDRVRDGLRGHGLFYVFNTGDRLGTAPPPPPPEPAIVALNDPELDAGVRFHVSRPLLERVVTNHEEQQKLLSHARIVPRIAGGSMKGFRVYAIMPGSLWSRIGLANGDGILSVNGKELATPDRALEIFNALRGASVIKLVLERSGAPASLEIVIDDH